MENWFSIIPFIVALVVAMLTRQVLVGLTLDFSLVHIHSNQGFLTENERLYL